MKLDGLKNLRKQKNFPVMVFLAVIILGYTAFFTSKLWYPDTGDLIDATAYYEKINYENYEMYLTQWKYSERDAAMQIILELSNKEVLDTPFVFGAVERTSGDLDIKPVFKTPEFVVLRISSIPERWKEISLRVSKRGTENQAKFYTNVSSVERVEKLPKQTDTGYQIDRLQQQKKYDDIQIAEQKEIISRLQEENEKLADKITKLEEDSYLSEEEVKQAEELISKAKSQIKSNEDNIHAAGKEIESRTSRTENILKQIKELKQEK